MSHCRACHEKRLDKLADAAKRLVFVLDDLVDSSTACRKAINVLSLHIKAYEKDKEKQA
jgi:hypothetical protein